MKKVVKNKLTAEVSENIVSLEMQKVLEISNIEISDRLNLIIEATDIAISKFETDHIISCLQCQTVLVPSYLKAKVAHWPTDVIIVTLINNWDDLIINPMQYDITGCFLPKSEIRSAGFNGRRIRT